MLVCVFPNMMQLLEQNQKKHGKTELNNGR